MCLYNLSVKQTNVTIVIPSVHQAEKPVEERATKPEGLLFEAAYTCAMPMASIRKEWHTHFDGNK